MRLVHVYGLTETYAPFTRNIAPPGAAELPPDERARLQARQGVPHTTAGEVRVVDEALKDVPADGQTLGEVVMRGNVVTRTAPPAHAVWCQYGHLTAGPPFGSGRSRPSGRAVSWASLPEVGRTPVRRTNRRVPAASDPSGARPDTAGRYRADRSRRPCAGGRSSGGGSCRPRRA